jgi:hypothetical protein
MSDHARMRAIIMALDRFSARYAAIPSAIGAWRHGAAAGGHGAPIFGARTMRLDADFRGPAADFDPEPMGIQAEPMGIQETHGNSGKMPEPMGIQGTRGNYGTHGNSEPMGISEYHRMADRIIKNMASIDKFDYLSDYADEPAHDIGTGSLHWALLTDIARTGPAVFCERMRENYDA